MRAGEQGFDRQTGYKRDHRESFDYCHAMKNGGVAAIREQVRIRVEQEFHSRQEQAQLGKVEQQLQGFLIGGKGLLLISAFTVGLSFGLYRENTRLKENEIKFRMIRQSIPAAARWADTIYHGNPKVIEKVLKKKETEQQDLIKAGSEAKFQGSCGIKRN